MRYGIFVSLFLTLIFVSCNNDDDGGPESLPPRALSEVSAEDDADIKAFLETHFYNYEEFESPPADFDYKIKIDTIAGDNAGKTPLMDMVRSTSIAVSTNEHGLDIEREEDVPHILYYLSARPTFEELDAMGPDPSVGAYPTVADSVYVRYEGRLLDGTIFDGSTFNPIWFDLARLQDLSQGARGFAEGIPFLKTGGAIIDNGDGTVSVEDYGVGMILFPSGLGYYNDVRGQIPQYSPLMFHIDLFTLNRTDHDNDGIPSIEEDVNGNGFLYDDNTDADEEDRLRTPRFANFQDADDDGDGKSTRSEISDENGEIIFPYPDSDNDGVPDYLDPDN
ncbi:FKBP-type peptidyl-prolyl cis-trans isomerase [Flagellimonas iocasae]|uniref:peptidylprolyl isomerase n=1 Tax=Flagellimonas iocasae TaxID=2055905 RepID=A0ABW4Y3E5_9FLAO